MIAKNKGLDPRITRLFARQILEVNHVKVLYQGSKIARYAKGIEIFA